MENGKFAEGANSLPEAGKWKTICSARIWKSPKKADVGVNLREKAGRNANKNSALTRIFQENAETSKKEEK